VITIAVEGLTERIVVTDMVITRPALDHVRSLRLGIADASRLRFTLAHETTHLLLNTGSNLALDCTPNYIGSIALMGSIGWLAGLTQANSWFQVPLADDVLAGSNLTVSLEETAYRPWSHCIGAPVRVTDHAQSSRVPRGPLVSQTLLAVELGPENRAALVRLLNGILAVLALMLILVLAVLARRPNALAFVLVMLAACLHFGCRGEPDDDTSLPMRRSQTSLGSCPHD
jgi:hypothetical protein